MYKNLKCYKADRFCDEECDMCNNCKYTCPDCGAYGSHFCTEQQQQVVEQAKKLQGTQESKATRLKELMKQFPERSVDELLKVLSIEEGKGP